MLAHRSEKRETSTWPSASVQDARQTSSRSTPKNILRVLCSGFSKRRLWREDEWRRLQGGSALKRPTATRMSQRHEYEATGSEAAAHDAPARCGHPELRRRAEKFGPQAPPDGGAAQCRPHIMALLRVARRLYCR